MAKKSKHAGATRKGNLSQRMVAKLLEADGYRVEVVRSKPVFSRGRRFINPGEDFFGTIDIIAVHNERQPLMVQVTSKGHLSAKRKALADFRPFGVQIEVWIFFGGEGKHFRVYQHQDDFTECVKRVRPLDDKKKGAEGSNVEG